MIWFILWKFHTMYFDRIHFPPSNLPGSLHPCSTNFMFSLSLSYLSMSFCLFLPPNTQTNKQTWSPLVLTYFPWAWEPATCVVDILRPILVWLPNQKDHLPFHSSLSILFTFTAIFSPGLFTHPLIYSIITCYYLSGMKTVLCRFSLCFC